MIIKKLFLKNELKYLGLFYLEIVLSNILLITYIYFAIYFMQIGFSLTQIGVLLAISRLTILIFEIPTGSIADNYGRKFSTILGYIISIILYISIIFTTNFYIICILYALMGIAFTLISGAYDSWIIDNLKYNKQNKLLQEFFIKERSLINFSIIFTGILGVIITKKYGLVSIWYLGALAFFVGLIILLNVKEYGFKKIKKPKKKNKIILQIKKSLKEIRKKEILKLFIILTFIYTFWVHTAGICTNLWPILFNKLNLKDYLLGYLFTISGIIGIFAPFLIKKIKIKKDSTKIIILLSVLITTGILMIFLNQLIYLIIIFLIIQFLRDIIIPINKHLFHKNVQTKNRATIDSTKSMITSIAIIIVLPLSMYLAEIYGIKNIIIYSFILIIPVIFLYNKIRKIEK